MTNARQLENNLQRSLGSGYVVVAQPDHPLLLVGPDILIGGEGHTTAVFLAGPTARPKMLRAKLIASRLALPTNTRTVLVGSDQVVDHPDSRGNFDEILGGRAPERFLERYIRGDAVTKVDGVQLLEIKRRQQKIFSKAFLEAKMRQYVDLDSGVSKELIRVLKESALGIGEQPLSIGNRYSPRKHGVYFQGSWVLSLSARKENARNLKHLWASNLAEDFVLDTGIPFSSLNSLSVMLADGWPRYPGDPQKLLRAYAFSGYVLSAASSVDEVKKLIEHIQRPIRRSSYERS